MSSCLFICLQRIQLASKLSWGLWNVSFHFWGTLKIKMRCSLFHRLQSWPSNFGQWRESRRWSLGRDSPGFLQRQLWCHQLRAQSAILPNPDLDQIVHTNSIPNSHRNYPNHWTSIRFRAIAKRSIANWVWWLNESLPASSRNNPSVKLKWPTLTKFKSNSPKASRFVFKVDTDCPKLEPNSRDPPWEFWPHTDDVNRPSNSSTIWTASGHS